MKKNYNIEVDCPSCANKIEEKIKQINNIKDAQINFMLQKLIIEYEDSVDEKELLKEIIKQSKKVEPDFVLNIE
ncbi:MAG: heavy metal-associated domain-containing protein [Eubacteriales bacterium]|nr:heavy metal-associated domain-containing protein [Eubacteriales bacterium]